MSWTHVRFGSILTRNTDGTDKPAPKFWTPERGRFSVPMEGSDHGRPFVIFESVLRDEVLVMKIYPDQIIARLREETITLTQL